MKRPTQTKAAAKKVPRRRDVLLALGFGAGAATAPRLAAQVAPERARKDDKGKSLYQANSPDVQTYYRVNRYPK
jgi:hypothetical protein